ncbi:B12-binding domain-containing radical SAM protein [Candidatus Magnetomonas plexicatena]|uniref:B12-binding domain-containing radical SAM protein n=1 Tax=Candidatus Magnetomonas plexicatena TaxID=2552947 RepID=UPI001103AA30|nr:B12-binding domain-containing radical SAM protein [Nitrospirales bacterium LBB_01]
MGKKCKITFVYPDVPSLGVQYLMAVCQQAGHEAELVYYEAMDSSVYRALSNIPYDKTVDEVLKTNPDIVAFSCVTKNYQFQLQCARVLKQKKPELLNIFGGVHITAVPESVLKNEVVDSVAIGEGEVSLPLFLSACAASGTFTLPDTPVRGIVYKKDSNIVGAFEQGEMADLNALPFPDKSIFYKHCKAFSIEYMIMTSRGCPYKCTYCFNSYSREQGGAGGIRRRSVDNVIDELVMAKKKYSIKEVIFTDDNFTTNKEWVLEFCKKYKEQVHLPFMCQSIPRFVNKEIAEALSGAGACYVNMGVQSVSEVEICQKVLNRKSNNNVIAGAVKTLTEAGILVQLDHILGIPGDTLQFQEEAVEFYNQFRPLVIATFWLQYYPKTAIVDIAKEQGILTNSDIEKMNEGLVFGYKKGTLKDPEPYFGISFLLNYIPFMPRWMVKFVLRLKLYKRVKISNFFISVIIPHLIRMFFDGRNIYERNMLFRYLNKEFPKLYPFIHPLHKLLRPKANRG